MTWRRTTFTLGVVAASLLSSWIPSARAGNTTCASKQLDWYSSVVGESPYGEGRAWLVGVTYERLRQICNPDYQVPNFRPNTPGDQCNDQVSSCCCNSVAFQLSMLCMNCQYDTQEGNAIGIDAGKGAYQLYRGTCGAGTNHSLPQDIQQAVCNKDIRLDNYLYGGWDDGSWFYVYSKQSASRDHAVHNNNTFTHCPNQISPSVTPTPTSTGTSSNDASTTNASESRTGVSGPTQANSNANSNNSDSGPDIGATVGGVLGGVAAILIAVVIFLYWRIRWRNGASTRGTQDHHYEYPFHNDPANPASPAMTTITPFVGSIASVRGGSASASAIASDGGLSYDNMTWRFYCQFRPFSLWSPSPAYRSWERESESGAGSQVSEAHTFGQSNSDSNSQWQPAYNSPVSSEVGYGDRKTQPIPVVPLRRVENA
ncbi:hypothetical protein C8Q74DRAFT_1218752 [Fomes fomentarius]|nr:hypothetical protein C8Q74DRAFT_1218752 [Fomes fomentarius]